MKMRRCEDEKMFYRPPLLEEPGAQTLSGKITVHYNLGQEWAVVFFKTIFSVFLAICSSLEMEAAVSKVFAAFWKSNL